MTRKAQIRDGAATELFPFQPFTGLDGRAMPANWLANASPAELEAEAIYDIVETTPPSFPEKIDTVALEISAGPTVTEVFTPIDMTLEEQRVAIVAQINATEDATLSSQFQGTDANGGYTYYPLNTVLRDMLMLWGQVAQLATLGRRAQGTIDWNGSDQPEVGSGIEINGVDFTYVDTTPATDFEIEIQGDSAATVEETAWVLNACADPAVGQATYAKQGFNALAIVHKTFTTVGNGFTIAVTSSPSAHATATGATLSGGLDAWQPGRDEWHHPDGFPHLFGLTNVAGVKVVMDAYSLINVVRNLAFFVDTVTGYARDQRAAAVTAEAAEDDAELLVIWTAVNNPSNWDPGTPPAWP